MREAQRGQWNKAAIAVGVLGVIMAVVGLVLFVSVFFDVIRSVDGAGTFRQSVSVTVGPSGIAPKVFGSQGMGRVPNFVNAIVGVILFGIGGMLVRVAIGMGLVVNAKPLARWVGGVVEEARPRGTSATSWPEAPRSSGANVRCPSCSTPNNGHAKFCSQCGTRIG